MKKILAFVLVTLVCTTGVSSCDQLLAQIEQLNSGIGDLNGGIETNSTIEVKLDPTLQAQVDELVALALENIETTFSITPDGKVYYRRVMINGIDPVVLECYVFDTFGGWTYDPIWASADYQASLRPIEMTDEEKVNCVQNLPVDA